MSVPSIAWCPEPLGWGPLPLGIVVFSLSPQGAAPGPLSLSAPRGHRKRGAGPEKGARSLNELRKAHLLTITAQASAITSCRERQDVCLGVAACGSTTARVCPSLPEPEVSSGSSHRGSEGEEHFPFRRHPGRTRGEAGRAALLEGRSPGAGRAAPQTALPSPRRRWLLRVLPSLLSRTSFLRSRFCLKVILAFPTQ